MSLLEGGDFFCSPHDFRTADVTEWNTHMDDGQHRDEGTSTCVDCNAPIKFSVPYVPFKEDGTKGVREKYAFRCDNCRAKIGTAEVSNL